VTPDWLFRIQHALASLIGAACTGYLAWCLWLRAAALARAGETTSQLQLKLAWLTYAMAILMALTAVALVVTLFACRIAISRARARGRSHDGRVDRLAAFLLLAFMRIPMAFAMGIVGFFGFALKVNFGAAASMIAQTTYETGLAYTLSVIPLFILMGNFVVRARMSEELYHAAYTFLGHRRGGLAMSTIVACAGFGAICGSSIATAATFAKVAYPSMRKFGYKDTLAAGSIAAGGTLGILIPPSVIMVIYGIMTETNIGKLFAAGILPGIVATVLLCLAVAWMTWRDPQAGPRASAAPGRCGSRRCGSSGRWWCCSSS